MNLDASLIAWGTLTFHCWGSYYGFVKVGGQCIGDKDILDHSRFKTAHLMKRLKPYKFFGNF
jgi:hypothetical protein